MFVARWNQERCVALRELAFRVQEGPRACAWALGQCGDDVDLAEALLRRDPRLRPPDLRQWALREGGLEVDDDPRLRLARRLGSRKAALSTATHQGRSDTPVDLADALALATDLLPIGPGWCAVSPDEGVEALADATGRGLAYRREPASMERYVVRARRFLELFDGQAAVLCNTIFRGSSGRSWSPVTFHTFDLAVAAVSPTRVGIAYVVDED